MGILKKLFGSKKENNTDQTDNAVKICFSFHSNILEEWTVETMWAETIDAAKGLYKLDNIPFYVPLVASDDIVFAEYDETEERLVYRYTVENSGNSTIHVVIMDTSVDKETIRDVFNQLGCISEGLNERYFAMEVPADTNFQAIKLKLDELKDNNTIDYAESCLSGIHQY
jgi:hypothetical protein